jgi:hypothetical protein
MHEADGRTKRGVGEAARPHRNAHRQAKAPSFVVHAGSTKRLDIADQVIDLSARQSKVRHRPMWMRQKSAQLVGGYIAVRNRLEGRRALRHLAPWVVADHMAIGAPLPCELPTSGSVGIGGMCASRSEHEPHR